ncbi:HAMP domain-containing protein [Tumebacillus sp. ITR2]|uniref:HAMP domain-containing protein n=1 Tax=Tumebacillus amylolyticus TaxID=2801339 RepID=A0ABS1JCW5_9BACL|nr:adenylate/guanylate cyclase domain-containing protein [Tumebacillus amylolyticus]MBL0388105.1 HAMP domain-containing protein [Tumebacillus amylolyticus]
MKRYVWRVIVLLLVMAGLSYGLWIENDFLNTKPFESQVTLNNPTRVISDANWLYVIENSKRELVKYDRGGTWKYDIDAPEIGDLAALTPTLDSPDTFDSSKIQDANKYYLRFGNAVSEDNGGLYALVQVMDEKALTLKYEVLCHYTAEGNLDSDWGVYIQKYDSKKNGALRSGTVKALQMRKGRFTFLALEQGVLKWNSYDESIHKFKTLYQMDIPSNLYLSEVLGSKPDDLTYSTMQGTIYKRGGVKLYPLTTPSVGDEVYAESIQRDAQNRVWFLDPYGKSIKQLDPQAPEGVQTILTVEQAQQKLGKSEQSASNADVSFEKLTVAPDGTQFVIFNDHVLVVSADGSQVRTLDYSTNIQIKQWLYWAGLALLVLLFIWLCKTLYMDIMPKSILLKQVFILFPLIAVCMIGLSFIIQIKLSAITDTEVRHSMEYVVKDAQNLVHAEELQKIQSPLDFMGIGYQALFADVHSEERDGRYYLMVHKVKDDRAYSVFEDDNDVKMFDSFPLTTNTGDLSSCKILDPELGAYEDVNDVQLVTHLQNHNVVTCTSQDENGTWLFALGPLFDKDKTKMVGVFEAGVNMYSYDQQILEERLITIMIVTGFTILILGVVLLVTWLQLRRITRLQESVSILRANPEEKRSFWIEDHSQDQVGELGRQFNEMAASIQESIEQTKQLRDAYKRYFPENLELYLGKDITSLDLGDQKILEHMSVLVINIHDFRQGVNNDPQETYDLINNRFLAHVSKEVAEHGGMIAKFLEAGVVALFPKQPADAYAAAVGMCRRLEVPVGIGIHTGDITLGVIGADDRLDSSLISDQVILTGTLEQLTEHFKVTLLTTKSTYEEGDATHRVPARNIGKISLEGRTLELYDVFEADDQATRLLKSETKPLFEEGVTFFKHGRFYDARERFVEVMRRNPHDLIARLYFYQSDEFYRTGVALDWDGSLSVTFNE